MFKIIKKYYDKGIYDKDDVKKFVLSGVLTKMQYGDIVGEAYKE